MIQLHFFEAAFVCGLFCLFIGIIPGSVLWKDRLYIAILFGCLFFVIGCFISVALDQKITPLKPYQRSRAITQKP